jgi:transposase
LSDWVGQAVWLLQPIVEGIRSHVFAAEKIHGDDTRVPVLEPGLGRTRTERLWVYVRDDRPFCGPAPPAAVYFYSPDRGGEHPAAHLAHFTGFLQADAYSGFAALYEPRDACQGLPAMPAITEDYSQSESAYPVSMSAGRRVPRCSRHKACVTGD